MSLLTFSPMKQMKQYTMKKNPLFIIIILNYNNYYYTKNCLASLYNLSYSNYKIIVVDDCSKDDSVIRLKKDYPNTILIQNSKNLNYCASFNVGVKAALKRNAEYVFFVNNDTKKFSVNYLDAVLKTFESNEKVGMVGSKCYDYNGGVRRNEVASIRFGIRMDIPTEGYVIKREVFEKVGYFNERLKIYFEDLDFIVRMRNEGYETKINTEISFLHYGGGTTSKIVFISNYFRVRNMFLFTRKYCSDRSFKWKYNEIKGNLGVHYFRLKKSLLKMELLKFIQLLSSILLGIIIGSFIPLKKIWN